MRSTTLLALLLPVWAFAQATPAVNCLADFEDAKAWPGTTISTDLVKSGKSALRWSNLAKQPTLTVAGVPADWTGYDRLSFWLHSAKANGQMLTIVANSENPANGKEEWDYYFHHLTVDWTGWRLVTLRKGADLQGSRRPLGWDQIQSLSINSGGWDHAPLPDTDLVIDDLCLARDVLGLQAGERSVQRQPLLVTQKLSLANRDDKPLAVRLALEADGLKCFEAAVAPAELPAIAPGGSAEVTVTLKLKANVTPEPLAREAARLVATPVDSPQGAVTMDVSAAVPLPPRPHPRLFLTRDEIAAAKARAGKYPWAAAQLKSIISAGEASLNLNVAEIPDHGGQWSHYYVCKACGVSLQKQDATHHLCPKCKQVYSGWPWDDVIVANVHHSFTSGIERLGLAYAFTGDEKYAQKAREILLAYGDKYPTFKYHDSSGGGAKSGGRLYAQTLDESVDIIGVAWGYDLVHDAPCFTAEDHQKIETGYLREACRTIQRHDAGISNWQTWHNAGVAAVGFCLDDPDLISWAINGKSGLRFQLSHSILPDGFWFEGTAGYHFYALDALRYTVEAAYHAGLDFYQDASYRSLYDAPLQYTFPDGSFPAINDSSRMGIGGQHRLYDLAYSRFKDPNFAWVASFGKRGSREAFLWGVDELPEVTAPKLDSKNFIGLGAAVLRVGEGQDAAYVHFDYGPHGGGHGHPDKLVVALYALGQEIGPDPGCLAYAAALHGSWYRQTFAHNTIVVDEKNQVPTEGKCDLFASWPDAAMAAGSCSTAYPGVKLSRAVLLTPTYLLDLNSASSDQPHTYDYLWHGLGQMTPGGPLAPRAEPLGKGNGYQHFTDIRSATGEQDWTADFKVDQGQARLTMLGAPGTELYFGTGMTGRPPAPNPMLVARRQGNGALFTSIINFSRTQPEVTAVTMLPVTIDGQTATDQQALAVKVTRGEAEDFFLMSSVPGEKKFWEFTTTAKACFIFRQGGKVVSTRQVE